MSIWGSALRRVVAVLVIASGVLGNANFSVASNRPGRPDVAVAEHRLPLLPIAVLVVDGAPDIKIGMFVPFDISHVSLRASDDFCGRKGDCRPASFGPVAREAFFLEGVSVGGREIDEPSHVVGWKTACVSDGHVAEETFSVPGWIDSSRLDAQIGAQLALGSFPHGCDALRSCFGGNRSGTGGERRGPSRPSSGERCGDGGNCLRYVPVVERSSKCLRFLCRLGHAALFAQIGIFAILGVGAAGVMGAGFFALSRLQKAIGLTLLLSSVLLFFGVGWLAREVGYCKVFAKQCDQQEQAKNRYSCKRTV